jgi:hypothetical protein
MPPDVLRIFIYRMAGSVVIFSRPNGFREQEVWVTVLLVRVIMCVHFEGHREGINKLWGLSGESLFC